MTNRNAVNLNINPCKMCMPMGAVLALKGIENSMVLLHGSQGCSTYIRRHMAGHYNEPIDIASSSLNEEGTVYGGENNLKKGLKNIIKVYNPDVIGVATTCLAETIGEDIRRITAEFKEEEMTEGVKIIPVQTPGYGGTQFEGYFSTLRSLVAELATDKTPKDRINLIVPPMSPGDIRNIKNMLETMKIQHVLFPDCSDTLDAPYAESFRKIPQGGTGLQDIEGMAGAVATVEMSVTVPENLSPGRYLEENFGVPLYRCPIPIGIENTDRFLWTLSEAAGKEIPEKFKRERGRLLDGMIDSHKHNAEGRAVIYGEPELTYAVAGLCRENGIKPVLIATGSQNEKLKHLLEAATSQGEFSPKVVNDTDFEFIEKQVLEQKANLLLGNSDGKFITERHGVPLVRMGFPIHDRVGGQRLVYTGYDGTLQLLDNMTNTLLERKYESYRQNMYQKYYLEPQQSQEETSREAKQGRYSKELMEKTKSHPCFTPGACNNARMHIPIAPACNISCNYCNRKYDCVNESRPGVTSEVLTPEQAAEKFMTVKSKLTNLKVVGIAGPGDALANFSQVRKSVELIKKLDPGIMFCLSTNGLMLPYYAEEIIALGIQHVTITINAIDPEIGAKIIGQINYLGHVLKGSEAAAQLLKNQLQGLEFLASRGVICKVNIVMIKGINDQHIEAVVKKVKECGAYMTNIMPLIPAKGAVFENMPLTSNKELNSLRKKCGLELLQMYHCKQCRADAIGTLGQDISQEFRSGCSSENSQEEPRARIVRFAVASKSGILVDEHFGHAEEFYIYEYRNGTIQLLEKRKMKKYCTGVEECDNEENKLDRAVSALSDCKGVLVLRIGYHPSKKLAEKGIHILQTCMRIEDAIRTAVKEMDAAVELLETVI